MKKLIMLICALVVIIMGSGQALAQAYTGEYHLQGVMETASGFKLNADSTFQFYYSIGALDRYGSGKWSVQDPTIVFSSKKRPLLDFALLNSKSVPGNLITIKIVDKNTAILRYVECTLKDGVLQTMKKTNEEGFARFQKQEMEAIALMFSLCPDRPSVFPVANKTHNYFEFRLESWIAEVFFEDFSLQVEKNQLSGKHPLLNGSNYYYEKQ